MIIKTVLERTIDVQCMIPFAKIKMIFKSPKASIWKKNIHYHIMFFSTKQFILQAFLLISKIINVIQVANLKDSSHVYFHRIK